MMNITPVKTIFIKEIKMEVRGTTKITWENQALLNVISIHLNMSYKVIKDHKERLYK